jgi:hypothetical protein
MEHKTPHLPTPEPGPKVLSFEEFIFRDPELYLIPRYNNFFMHFIGPGLFGDIYKESPWYQKFASEHSDMVELLENKIRNKDKSNSTAEALKPFERELYEAYKIMRGYGASDTDLFA